jgi:hypothetical protein
VVADISSSPGAGFFPNRRQLLQSTSALLAATSAISGAVLAQPVSRSSRPVAEPEQPSARLQGSKFVGFMLPHEQYSVPELVKLGENAARGGFGVLATSDHLLPWQANEGHCGQA